MTIVNTKDTDWHLLTSNPQIKAVSSAIKVDSFNSAKQSTPRDWLPIIFRYEEPLPVVSVNNKKRFDSSNQYVDGWISRIREELYSNPSVEDIFISIEDSDVDVWVVIPERDIVALTQLANTEWELLKVLVSGEHPAFLIDFHIIYRCGRKVEELVPTKVIRLPRQV